MLDAHFHLDLFRDNQQILTDIARLNIFTIAVTNSPTVFPNTLAISKRVRNILPAVGLHPELVGQRSKEITSLLDLITTNKFVGEVGLDYSSKYSKEDRLLQQRIFERIVKKCHDERDKVISIHSRRATTDVLSIIGQNYPGTVILHWFSGTKTDLKKAIASDYYFSINPAMIKSKSGQQLITEMPPSKLLTETDGPFVEVHGRPAEPTDISLVVDFLSDIWRVEKAFVIETLDNNAKVGNIIT